jgi:hypothetical protein
MDKVTVKDFLSYLESPRVDRVGSAEVQPYISVFHIARAKGYVIGHRVFGWGLTEHGRAVLAELRRVEG